jgi:hypothetical protein
LNAAANDFVSASFASSTGAFVGQAPMMQVQPKLSIVGDDLLQLHTY